MKISGKKNELIRWIQIEIHLTKTQSAPGPELVHSKKQTDAKYRSEITYNYRVVQSQ